MILTINTHIIPMLIMTLQIVFGKLVDFILTMTIPFVRSNENNSKVRLTQKILQLEYG